MTFLDYVNLLGAAATAAMGCLGLLAPKACARLVGLRAANATGFSEFRATYGGLFLMLGLLPMITLSSMAFLVSGLAWAGAGAGRVVSIFADKANEPANLRAVAIELGFACLLLAGQPLPGTAG